MQNISTLKPFLSRNESLPIFHYIFYNHELKEYVATNTYMLAIMKAPNCKLKEDTLLDIDGNVIDSNLHFPDYTQINNPTEAKPFMENVNVKALLRIMASAKGLDSMLRATIGNHQLSVESLTTKQHLATFDLNISETNTQDEKSFAFNPKYMHIILKMLKANKIEHCDISITNDQRMYIATPNITVILMGIRN